MGNAQGKGDSKYAKSAPKKTMGELIRQGSMPGDAGMKSSFKAPKAKGSQAQPANLSSAPLTVDILEAREAGVWPAYAVSSVQGIRKGMEDEFSALDSVSRPSQHPPLCLSRLFPDIMFTPQRPPDTFDLLLNPAHECSSRSSPDAITRPCLLSMTATGDLRVHTT